MRGLVYSCSIYLVSYKMLQRVCFYPYEMLMIGRGRGRQVVSVAKTADLIVLMSKLVLLVRHDDS
jgi:hypothetical protein